MSAMVYGKREWADIPLTGRLEEEPLELLDLLLILVERNLALGVVFLDQVRDQSVRLPIKIVVYQRFLS